MPRGSWLVTGRRTYYDVFAERITDNDLPSFADLQAKARVAARRRPPTDAVRARQPREHRRGVRGRVSRRPPRSAESIEQRRGLRVVPASLGGADDDRTRSWRGIAMATRSTSTDPFATESTLANSPNAAVRALGYRLHPRRWACATSRCARSSTWRPFGRHTLGTGLEVHALVTDWAWGISGDRNQSAANGSCSASAARACPTSSTRRVATTRVGGWVEDEWQASSALAARGRPPDRLEQSVGRDAGVAARQGDVRVRAHDAAEALPRAGSPRAPATRNCCNPTTSSTSRTRRPPGLRSAQSGHAIAGIEHDIGAAITARVEAYYKTFDRLVVGRLETPDETAARVAQYAFPADAGVERADCAADHDGAGQRQHGRVVRIRCLPGETAADRTRDAERLGVVHLGPGLVAAGTRPRASVRLRPPPCAERGLLVAVQPALGSGDDAAGGVGLSGHVPRRRASRADARRGRGRRRTRQPGAASRLDGPATCGPSTTATSSNLNAARLPMFARLDLRLTYRTSPTSRWSFYGRGHQRAEPRQRRQHDARPRLRPHERPARDRLRPGRRPPPAAFLRDSRPLLITRRRARTDPASTRVPAPPRDRAKIMGSGVARRPVRLQSPSQVSR